LVGGVLSASVDLVVIFTVFSFVPHIEGFSTFTGILIYGMYGMVESIFFIFFAWTLWFSHRYIIQGDLITVLSRPSRALALLMATNASREELLYLAVRFAVFIFAVVKLRLTFLRSLALLACVIPGVLMLAGIFVIVACIGARYPKSEEAFTPLMQMIGFAKYPTSIYPRSVRFLLNWVVPYSLIAFVPVSIILGLQIYDFSFNLWWLPVYGFGIFSIAYILFYFTANRFESTGT
jgi:ABC-2 type transport system permease protein